MQAEGSQSLIRHDIVVFQSRKHLTDLFHSEIKLKQSDLTSLVFDFDTYKETLKDYRSIRELKKLKNGNSFRWNLP